MTRIDIINNIISRNGFKSYLEIGVRHPDDCFNWINCESKDSVDPGVENKENPVKYKYTSDSFFNLLESGQLDRPKDYKWDVIFIDGLHVCDQVERDIINSLNHLSRSGYIVLHDCNPPTTHHARENYYDYSTPAGALWNGSVWKAIYKMRCLKTDIHLCTIDTDWGCGIITKGNQPVLDFENPYFEYTYFEKNRQKSLNLILPEQLEQWLDKPFYV